MAAVALLLPVEMGAGIIAVKTAGAAMAVLVIAGRAARGRFSPVRR